ncbi:hypothetical protein M378DRAFT_333123 [Amanita muscaria Koide BX008]|uniref:Uncharacterized protein n=1 Tax=Amanita muscaria (strain Koide BX008) TaxID=946122 RepID=A0A0C2WPY9_AMAMK|nr:hypothetical protein M378DRAFT_333123 [Amanita muscaria Koide BX008]
MSLRWCILLTPNLLVWQRRRGTILQAMLIAISASGSKGEQMVRTSRKIVNCSPDFGPIVESLPSH